MTTIEQLLNERFGGVILRGQHQPDGQCCILELESQRLGIGWTDEPAKVRMFDLRAINDAKWSSDALRTEHMLRLHAAYVGSLDWPQERQRAVADRIFILTVQRLIAELPGLPDAVRDQCRAADTLAAARAAADAARAAADAVRAAAYAVRAAAYAAYAVRAAAYAAYAARAAAYAARAAAYAADAVDAAADAVDAAADAVDAAADAILISAVDLWIEASQSPSAALGSDSAPSVVGSEVS